MNPSALRFLIFRRSVSVRIGLFILSILQFSAFSSSRFPSVPIYTVVDVTTSSRIASIGGFVTWANNCLKYPKETRWIGTFSEVYCGVENGVYKIKIDDKDQDDLFWKGRFYDIEEVFDILKPIHQKAVRMQQKYDADKEN